MDASVAAFKLTGLCAANFQAFDAAGECDHAAAALHVANLARQGVTSVFCCGTTGESLKLSVAERKASLEAWVAAAAAAGTGLRVVLLCRRRRLSKRRYVLQAARHTSLPGPGPST